MSAPPPLLPLIAVRWCLALGLVVALAACGGGQDSTRLTSAHTADLYTSSRDTAEARTTSSSSSLPASKAPPSAAIVTAQQEGARLNTAELDQIAKTGVLPPPFEGPLLSGAPWDQRTSVGERKRSAERVPVYRFFNAGTSAHFFTTSESERDTVMATLPAFSFEGPAFSTADGQFPGLSPVHRFFNTATGVHFYTISESERAHVTATLPQFHYEGIGYYASTMPGTGYVPLYRFFYATKGFHFYTNSLAERDNIIATLPQYSYEGIGYYVLGDDWRAPVIPHSGVTSLQCYADGSNTLVACSAPMALGVKQDGNRSSINRPSYAQYTRTTGSVAVTYPTTECVVDNITGLMWEGKTPTGTRAGSNTYTNHGDGRVGDATAYVDSVNARNVCGFTDWRLPTVEELLGLVHFGETGGARISLAWFPHTYFGTYWASNDHAMDPNTTWGVSFVHGQTGGAPNSAAQAVRLVRGAAWTGARYLITSASYPGDATNNVATDRKTGLSWRRCLQGQSWNGSACVGSANTFAHEAALRHAQSQNGWRMPNTKELGSLVDHARAAPTINTDIFPGASSDAYWSSSPNTVSSSEAFFTWFAFGSSSSVGRTTVYPVRLVVSD